MTIKEISKRGRPELPDSEKRSVITQFRCTPDERERLEQAAKTQGKRLSDWLRDQVVIAAKRTA